MVEAGPNAVLALKREGTRGRTSHSGTGGFGVLSWILADGPYAMANRNRRDARSLIRKRFLQSLRN